MAEKRGGFAYIPGLRTVLSYSTDGGVTYYEVPGIGSMSAPAGERPESDLNAFEGAASIGGEIPITDVTFPVTAYNPHDQSWIDIVDAWKANDAVQFRVQTPAEEALFGPSAAGKTAAIAMNTGIVTFAGQGGHADFTDPLYQRGHAIKIANELYPISSIDVNGNVVVVKVRPYPAANVVAAVYSVVRPQLGMDFGARVKNANSMEIGSDAGSVIGSNLVIKPAGLLPQMSIV